MNISAVDLGFMYNKGIINNKRVIHKSVVGEGRVLRFQNLDMGTGEEGDYITSELNDRKYFISDLAIQQSGTVYHSLKGDRFHSEIMEILINTTLGLGFGSGNHNTYVVSGLPVSHFSDYKLDIEGMFTGLGGKVHEYNIRTREENIEGTVTAIKGIYIPQPFAVLINEILDDSGELVNKELASGITAIIDCGFGTTDVYVTDGLTPIDRLTFSTHTAVNHAYRSISERIEEFHTPLPLYSIENIVMSRILSTPSGSYNITDIINQSLKSTSEQLVSEIYNKWGNIGIPGKIVISGGGGMLLGSYLKKEFKNMMMAKSKQFSVAEGYRKWGIRTWKGEL